MYIGSVANLPFGRFALMMAVPVLVGLLICWGVIAFAYGAQMHERLSSAPRLPADAEHSEVNRFLIIKTLGLAAVLVAFFYFAGANSDLRATGALVAAAILLISWSKNTAPLPQLVDWNLLLLFVGLFVVNGAMQQHNLIAVAFDRLTAQGLHVERPVTLTVVTTVLSNLVSNVPAVLLLKPKVEMSSHLLPELWYLLALVSTLAGNLTLLGSIANLIVAEAAAKYGVKISLKTYCGVGIPITVLSVAVGAAWLIAR